MSSGGKRRTLKNCLFEQRFHKMHCQLFALMPEWFETVQRHKGRRLINTNESQQDCVTSLPINELLYVAKYSFWLLLNAWKLRVQTRCIIGCILSRIWNKASILIRNVWITLDKPVTECSWNVSFMHGVEQCIRTSCEIIICS